MAEDNEHEDAHLDVVWVLHHGWVVRFVWVADSAGLGTLTTGFFPSIVLLTSAMPCWLPRGTYGAEAVRRLHSWVVNPFRCSQWLAQWLSSASTCAVDCCRGCVGRPPLPPVTRRVSPETLGEF